MARILTNNEIEHMLDFIIPNFNIPLESAMALVNLLKDRFRKQLIEQKIYPELIPELKKQLELNYRSSLIQPGESVGILAAMSIGEKNTQSSVAFGELILVRKGFDIIKIKVGEFIDSEMRIDFENVFEIGNSSVKEMKGVEILTISQNEKIEWQPITEISRHPTGGDLIKVTTESGRSVVTTLSHSLLLKHKESIVPVLGADLKINDKLPVIKNIENINQNAFKNIYTPYYFKYERIEGEYVHFYDEKLACNIIIDELFGWFLGYFLSNGYTTTFMSNYFINLKTINIHDLEFEKNIKLFTEKLGISYTQSLHVSYFNFLCCHIPSSGKEPINYNILSKLFYELLNQICFSNNKKILPSFIFGSTNSVIKALLKGWINGGGYVSDNPDMLKDFQILFSYFGIYTRIEKMKNQKSFQDYYRLSIQKKYEIQILDILDKLDNSNINDIFLFNDDVDVILDDELNIQINKLEGFSDTKNEYFQTFPTINQTELGNFIKRNEKESIDIERDFIDIEDDDKLKYLKQVYNSDVNWERIVKIELIKEADYEHEFVYDFSVKGNETFALHSGIVVHNTLNTFLL